MNNLQAEEEMRMIEQKAKEIMPSVFEVYKKEGVKGLMITVNGFIDKMYKEANIDKKVSCSKGCSLCCYSSINVTTFEADFIYALLEEKNPDLNQKRIEVQSKKKFHKLKYAEKSCAALGEDGSCQIYEYRPVICRLWNATTSPKQCSTKNGKPKTEMIKIAEAWALILCLIELDKMEGNLAGLQLHEVFERLNASK